MDGMNSTSHVSMVVPILALFDRNRKLIVFHVSVLIACGIILSFVLPKTYLARGSIMTVETNDGFGGLFAAASAMAKVGGGFGSVGKAVGLPGSIEQADVFAAILESRTVRESVIEQCNLISEYKLQKINQKKPLLARMIAVTKLKEHTKIDVTIEGIIQVDVVARRADLAAEIVNSYIRSLEAYNNTASNSRNRQVREFIESRIEVQKGELSAAEDSLRSFQQAYRTLSLPDEMKEAIKEAATLEALVVANQVKIDAMTQNLAVDNPQVRLMQQETEALRKQLKLKEHGSGGLFVSLRKAPAVGIELARRVRKLRIQEEVMSLLALQYEQAKINEKRDIPTVQIIDRAVPPAKKHSPKRLIILLSCAMLGLINGFVISYYREKKGAITARWNGFVNTVRSTT